MVPRMTARRSYTRHGLTAPMVKVKLAGFGAIDRRTAAARGTLAFRRELVAALGGEADLSPQRRKLVDMAARASLLLDHMDAWMLGQRSLVNARTRSLLPVVVQRQQIADHLARLLDKLGLDRIPQKINLTDYYREDAKPAKSSILENNSDSFQDAAAEPDDVEQDDDDVEPDENVPVEPAPQAPKREPIPREPATQEPETA